MTATEPAPANFDRVARIYRTSEYLALGTLLERTRFHLLPRLRGRSSALVLGDGDGRFAARLLAEEPGLSLVAVDTSAAMLGLLRARCVRAVPDASARLTAVHAHALTCEPPVDLDLIATHFFLDCLTQPEVEVLARRLAAKVQPGCLWLVSDFAVPPCGWMRVVSAAYIRALYLAFRLLTGLQVTRLPDPQRALSAAGFALRERATFCGGMLYTELWERIQPA